MTPKHNQLALPLNIDLDVLLMIQNLPRIPYVNQMIPMLKSNVDDPYFFYDIYIGPCIYLMTLMHTKDLNLKNCTIHFLSNLLFSKRSVYKT